jgi:hypothetical protein
MHTGERQSNYPQPYEGIVGTLRDEDDLLSLDDKAIPRRMMMANLALCLESAVLVGNPAPIVQRMGERMRKPEPGDLVLERTRFGRYSDVEAFGFLVAHRDEWWDTDEEYQRHVADGAVGADEPRSVDHAWYVQYGPQPGDMYRWVNCSFITVPTDRAFCRIDFGTRDDRGGVTVTRNDLLGHLADSGMALRGLP